MRISGIVLEKNTELNFLQKCKVLEKKILK